MTGEPKLLSSFRRVDYLDDMCQQPLDLLVVGGGITGAGIALDAASRGLRVGLVDKQDFAAGTSSRSTKLIHGGLRYLKQREFGLVREVGRERAILHRNAPHLVRPEQMLLPVIQAGTYGRWATSAGLWLYDRLAGVDTAERRRMWSRHQTAEQEPLLRTDILRGGGLYYEYRTDDARLTMEVLKTAAQFGALCVNYAAVTDWTYEDGAICGATVVDAWSQKAYHVRAQVVVNATGPWTDALRSLDGSLSDKRLYLTKGIHIVVPHDRLPVRHSIYFDVSDGRMAFAIPREGCTYIGTTDTPYQGDPQQPALSTPDVEYLLNAVNAMFPSAQLVANDIHSGWAGVRPLIYEAGKSASELSRKDEIFGSRSGLITIAGGKLTGYRKMAQRVVDRVVQRLSATHQRPFAPCWTDRIALSGGAFDHPRQVPTFIDQLTETYLDRGISAASITSLVHRYGTNTAAILEAAAHALADPSMQTDLSASKRVHRILLKAELQYTLDHEMVHTVSDFLLRRTSMLLFHRHLALAAADFLHDEIVHAMGQSATDAVIARRQFDLDCAATMLPAIAE